MPTAAEHLRVARDNYAAQLAALSDPAHRKVSYSIGGRTVSWTEYQSFLRQQVRDLTADIVALDPTDGGDLITALE